MGKFEAIYQDLARDIDQGKYLAGSLLPSEKALTETYGVSRETVRKALALLTDRGYIQRIMGKGSLVVERPRYPVWLSTADLQSEFPQIPEVKPSSTLLLEQEETLPYVPFQALTKQPLGPALVLHRLFLRRLGSSPLALTHHYLPQQSPPSSPASFLHQLALEQATPDDAQQLKLRVGEPVVVVTSLLSSADGRPVLYRISRYRPDRFRFLTGGALKV